MYSSFIHECSAVNEPCPRLLVSQYAMLVLFISPLTPFQQRLLPPESSLTSINSPSSTIHIQPVFFFFPFFFSAQAKLSLVSCSQSHSTRKRSRSCTPTPPQCSRNQPAQRRKRKPLLCFSFQPSETTYIHGGTVARSYAGTIINYQLINILGQHRRQKIGNLILGTWWAVRGKQ